MAEQDTPAKHSPEPGRPRTVDIEIEIVPPDSYTYSNVAGIATSPWDIRLHFAELKPNGRADTVAGVVMSPEHAAALTLVMFDTLRNYERQHGPIRNKRWAEIRKKSGENQGPAENQSANPDNPAQPGLDPAGILRPGRRVIDLDE